MLFGDGDDGDYRVDDDDDDDYEMMRSRIQINHGKLAVCGPRQVGRYRQSSHLQIVTMMMTIIRGLVMMTIIMVVVMIIVTKNWILLIVMMTIAKKVEGRCRVDCDDDYC